MLMVLILGLRSAAAPPLRRAMELHDNLNVLASYGVISGGAAALTGGFVYGELDDWGFERQVIGFVVAAFHCWGMRWLCTRMVDPKGHAAAPREANTPCGGHSRVLTDNGNALQMVDTTIFGASTTRGSAASSASAAGKDRPHSDLLWLDEPAAQRTVEEDAKIEEQLFARALSPAQLAPGIGGLPQVEDPAPGGWATGANWSAAWPETGGITGEAVGNSTSMQFDADFEEIMRRFDEDDRNASQGPAASGLKLQALDAPPTTPQPPQNSVLLGQDSPSVLTFDAQTLLDSNYGGQDDEDELLRCIEDLPGPDIPEL